MVRRPLNQPSERPRKAASLKGDVTTRGGFIYSYVS